MCCPWFPHSGCDHIIPLEMCIRHRDHVVFVMPYVKHDKFAVSDCPPGPGKDIVSVGLNMADKYSFLLHATACCS